MYYKYNEHCEIYEKSNEPLTGENVVFSDEDIDIQLFRVIVGFIDNDKRMLRHTKFIRSAELVSQRLSEIKTDQMEVDLETDFRLSMIELGLI